MLGDTKEYCRILENTKEYWRILGYSQDTHNVPQDTWLGCAYLGLDAQSGQHAHPSLNMSIQARIGVKNIVEYWRILRNIEEYGGILENTGEYWRILQNTREDWGIHIKEYWGILENTKNTGKQWGTPENTAAY